jgi:putative ABC transport system permease protein
MRSYEIIGFVNTKKVGGQIGLTARRNLKSDLKQSWGLRMAMKVLPGYDPEQMVTTIEGKLKNLNWYEVQTLASQKARYIEENKKIIMILSAFSTATALIGSIGVMNNFLVSFLARKKALAIYASVGMSKVQKKSMILIEAISGGLIGAVFGIMTTLLILARVSGLLAKIDVLLVLDLSLKTAILGMVGSVLVCLLSSLSVLRRSGKVSIIEELRYE